MVDDGSRDHTAEVAALAGATVVSHDGNRGYGRTIRTIIDEAGKRDGILVILDADAQHDPDEIPQLVQAIIDGADLAIGSRAERPGNIPAYRRVGQKVLSRFTRIASQSVVADTESGFRAYSPKAVKELVLKQEGMAVSAEIVTAAANQGMKIVEVPITVSYHGDTSTLNPVAHGVGVLSRIMEMISERRPLLTFGLSGGLLILTGIILGILVIVWLKELQVLQVGTAIIAVMLVTVGTFSISTGIILDELLRRASGKTITVIRNPESFYNRTVVWFTERYPLAVFGGIGLTLALAGIAVGVTVILTLGESQVLQAGSALLSMLFIIIGILSISTGLILRTLSRRRASAYSTGDKR